MLKYQIIKKQISLIILSLFITPLILVSQTATASASTPRTQAQVYQRFLEDKSCVASYMGDPLCTASPNLGNISDPDKKKTIEKLYKAIYSQGAVITLLDEPLSSEGLITVLRMCNYKRPIPGQQQVVINSCSEYYVDKCPAATEKISPKKIPSTTNHNEPLNEYAFFSCSTKQVLIAASGTGLIQKYLRMIYNFGTAAAGIFAILIIMFNGIKISISGSDEGAVDEAKKQITNSLLALAVLFLSGFILYIINPNFFTSTI